LHRLYSYRRYLEQPGRSQQAQEGNPSVSINLISGK
jgi:hypothetical protein